MPQTTRTFRVFVSSTFTDMRAERRILQEEVFPKLKALCESKGASFQDVDLRWGVNEEAQLDQKTMDICLGEIARCQRLSPKPNFIILLGDKYGWQPVPARIPSSEMELMRERLEDDEKALVARWYQEDLNAVPPEYVLQPREGECLPYEKWASEEAKLRDILRQAVARLPFTEEQELKYFASATHQEIMTGALNPPPGTVDPKEHVFAYLRTIRGLPEDSTAKDYIDISGNDRDAYSKAQLEKLKKEDLKVKLPHDHVYDYGVDWKNGFVLDDANAEVFEARVYADLRTIIESQLQESEDTEPLEKEIGQHEKFKKERLKHFTGRKDPLDVIRNYLVPSPPAGEGKGEGESTESGKPGKIFAIIGASGTGKTSVMAKAIEEARSRQGVKVFRFLGTTSATSDTYRFLSDLVREIAQEYGTEMNALLKEKEDETKLSTLRGLQEIFPRCLSLATIEKPLFLFLDALDQLSRDFASLSLDWIPKEIPEHVRIIVSALPELKEKLSHTVIYELGAMSVADAEKLLKRWLESIHRTLQTHQQQEVIDRFASNGTPLYLKLAFEGAREWHSYSPRTRAVLKGDIDGVLDEYFDVLEKDHGSLLVQKVCGYLLSGKYGGLTEPEILDLLVFDHEYWHYFLQHCHHDHKEEVQRIGKLPIVVWSRLFLDMEPYLTEREADGLSIIGFYHRKFADHTRQRYLSSPLHMVLADYFEKKPLYHDKKEERPDVRKVVEQPYQQTLAAQADAGRWKDVANITFANFPFLMAKTKANMVEGILEDYAFLWEKAPETLKENLDLWLAFFTERAYILRRGDPVWPVYKILVQLAVEHADDSPLTKGAERWLDEGKCNWPWLRRKQRLPHAGKSPCLAVLEEHTGSIKGALETKDGRFLSWSYYDHTLRLWDRQGKPLTVLEGHTSEVRGALEITDGRFLSWSENDYPSEDRTLRLWDREGKCIAILKGHADDVQGALETTDGRFLSWSWDSTPRLWDREGKRIAILKGHAGGIEGALETKDGRLLSWSRDSTLRLWDREGGPLAVLQGHKESITGALETTDGRFLSWSSGKKDRTLRLWDREGKSLAVLEGHADDVQGALETTDGRFLSWSDDHTLRLWDREGKPLAVLEGHAYPVQGALETTDGRFLSWSDDHTLRLWDREGKPLAVLEGHAYPVQGALETKDGRFLSWSYDSTLRLWDREGKRIAILKGHTGPVNGVRETTDGRFLSWSRDSTLRLWDREGKPLTVLEGHMSDVRGVLETTDGRFLSWSWDSTPRLWDREGKRIAILKGHTGGIEGALETKDGRLLSWSRDSTLRLWDREGASLAVLKGHKESITGALQTTDGRFLSWSSDGTLRLWDREGKCIAILKGHTGPVNGALETKDGRFLSWSDGLVPDHTLRLWDREGKPLTVLKGHTGPVGGALETTDGRFLSWSSYPVLSDHTLRLWDQEGKPLTVLKGHTGPVGGALETTDGRFLSWSSGKKDRTLRLWDRDGASLAVLKGHKESITGALETTDGRFLSWSEDRTLRHREGKSLGSDTIYAGLRKFPEFRITYLRKENNVSQSGFGIVNWRRGCLFVFSEAKRASIFWHGESGCTARYLKSDGLAVLTQGNGQVCFLQLYYGNWPISVEELEGIYGVPQVVDHTGAEPRLRRVLALREKVLGPEHPDTATSLENLGNLLYSKHDYDGAEPLYRRALAIREKVLGLEHPDTAQSLSNLAVLLHSKDDYDGAEPLYRRALAIREKVLGAKHPDTARSLTILAVLLKKKGDFDGAEPLYRRALAIREKVLGPEHPDTVASRNFLNSMLQITRLLKAIQG